MDFTLPEHPTATDLFGSYRRDYEAALNPCIVCLLNRCPPEEREALNALLDEWMMESTSPPYSPIQQRRIEEKLRPMLDRAYEAAGPALTAQQDQIEAKLRDTPWPLRVARKLRCRASLRWMIFRAKRRPPRWE